MEWLADPSIWMGLATLVVLEIVLGIDNLVFRRTSVTARG
jgi:predicted tellurium resistance membrane protein TerC